MLLTRSKSTQMYFRYYLYSHSKTFPTKASIPDLSLNQNNPLAIGVEWVLSLSAPCWSWSLPQKDAGLVEQGESTGGELEASHLTQREAGWLSQQEQGLAKLANASQLPIISASLPFSLIYLESQVTFIYRAQCCLANVPKIR